MFFQYHGLKLRVLFNIQSGNALPPGRCARRGSTGGLRLPCDLRGKLKLVLRGGRVITRRILRRGELLLRRFNDRLLLRRRCKLRLRQGLLLVALDYAAIRRSISLRSSSFLLNMVSALGAPLR